MVDELLDTIAIPPHLLAALALLNERIGHGLRSRTEASGMRIRGSEARILDLVAPGGTRPTALAAGAWISKQAIGKRIRGLEERGLVELTPDPEDGRAVLIHLTSEGARVRDATLEHVADLERELATQVGATRYREFRAVLDHLASGPPTPG